MARGGAAEDPRVSGRVYHLELAPGDIPPYVLLPGDPGRVDRILSHWEDSRVVASHREYRSGRGVYRGVELGAVSTGIGGSSTAIAVEELARVGVHTLIRVGTTGALVGDAGPGTLVIGAAAVRFDGASLEYAPPEYPAYAHPDAVAALVEAAERLGVSYRVGVVASTATFHLGQGRPGFRGYEWSESRRRLDDLKAMGVLSFEMEAATLYTLSSLYRLRSGCVCAVIANRVTGEFKPGAGVDDAIRVASEAARLLALLDRERGGYRWEPAPPSLWARLLREA